MNELLPSLMSLTDCLGFQSSLRAFNFLNGIRLHICSHRLKHCKWAGKDQTCQNSGPITGKFLLNSVLVKAVSTAPQVDNILSSQPQENQIANVISDSQIDISKNVDKSGSIPGILGTRGQNKRVPWNKGKKHRPETVQRIRERTKLALQDPRIRKKLAGGAHPQSEETRLKIAMSLKKTFEMRRKRKMLQETCITEWKEHIAEFARVGIGDVEVLQWDSYEIEMKKLREAWLESVKLAKLMRNKKRAPKSLEERKRISEVIKAKWTDPAYRGRVASGMKKVRERRKSLPGVDALNSKGKGKPSRSKSNTFKSDVVLEKPMKVYTFKSDVVLEKPMKVGQNTFKDPLVILKLEKIRKLRAHRNIIEGKKKQAVSQARSLIEETEKAAKALESVAHKDAHVQTLLSETRKLLAEAVHVLQTIDLHHKANANANVLEGKQELSLGMKQLQSYSHPDNSIAANATGQLSYFNLNSVHLNGNYQSAVRNSLNGTWHNQMYSQAGNKEHLNKNAKLNLHDYVSSLLESVSHVTKETDSVFKLAFKEMNGKDGTFPERFCITNDEAACTEKTQYAWDRFLSYPIEGIAGGNEITSLPSNSLEGMPQRSRRHCTRPLRKKWVRGRLVEVSEE